MDERSPLDNRSLSHTSREPEGQAWAQIGTKAPAKGVAVSAPPASNDSQSSPAPSKPAVSAASETSASSPPQPARGPEEDALSDDGRALQVVEDAETDPPANGDAANNKSSHGEEKTGGGAREEAAVGDTSNISSGGKSDDSRRGGGSDKESSDRTNSLDPTLICSRVFVGHLNTDKCSRTELEELFSPFGKVASCSLQHGYGFVQYCDEQAAARAITELHGLQFKGMKLVVDKTAAQKRMQGEDPGAPKPWSDRGSRRHVNDFDLRRREAAIYEREAAMYERSARLEEMEHVYYDRYPSYGRDPYYDRYYERGYRDPYVERYRHYSEVDHRGRYYGGPASTPPPHHERGYYEGGWERSSYDRPRDDPYDRRDEAFREHSLRDREPFERFDSSRRL